MDEDVAVVIVNFRTPHLTAAAVESVLREPETSEVVIVDNSPHRSEERAFLHDDPRVRVEVSNDNIGFGRASNTGAYRVRSPYLFLLNSDATVQSGCLQALRTVLDTQARVGLAAPQVFLPDATTPQRDAQGSFPTLWSIATRRDIHRHPSDTPDWVSGVAVMARRADFLRLGGFDEAYHMYLEDVDLCHRYRDAGFEIRREDLAGVVHLAGASRTSSDLQRRAYAASRETYLKRRGIPGPIARMVTLADRLR